MSEREDETKKKEDVAEDGEMELDREDGGGRGFRQVTRQGNDLCMYGAQKATCTSHRDEEKLQQLQKLLPAKKVLKNPRHSCNVFSLSLSPSPTLSISLSISSPLSPCFHLPHILLHIHALHPR